ncbi:centrosomal protein CEP57L1 isoform X2 [Pleuronectes platessa]|uniref:centrosomal protein CEP57L1 isoform X2 n=1 Tax=Pleuronectes platessa TaxID=8262 RepID=UPI00232A4295|nr:centrosomal protein CEP57L1 isoform X2 [Pleuronectes platessa]
METYIDQILDSPSKNSYIGSYYQPPDRIAPVPRQLGFSAPSAFSRDPQIPSLQGSQTNPNIDSRAVVDALKTLQDKIRRLELERKDAEKSYRQFSHDIQKQQEAKAPYTTLNHGAASLPETNNSGRRELDSKLLSAEARCKSLEKQLDYMRKMVEKAKKERKAVIENQASLQNEQPSSSNAQTQQEKLDKLESEYLKLSRTQSVAEMKFAILEQRLLKEEQERKRVQERADELQRELDISHQLSAPTNEEIKPKKRTKKTIKKTPKPNELSSPSGLILRKMPFVAGTSISPSHSVHANVQSILHMMKHHQPQLCERVTALHRSGCGAKKSLQKDFSPSPTGLKKPDGLSEQTDQPLGSLSDLLLALQDELGQMSFEHQDLLREIDLTQNREERQELQSELERLVARMEEKGVQITKLRKHQQTVHKLTQSQSRAEEYVAKKSPPAPFLVTAKQKGRRGGAAHSNRQLLRDTQKFRNCLKQDDLSWET